MLIRRAQQRDVEAIGRLLLQVARIHHEGRPDIFKEGSRKYTDEEVASMLDDDERPIFVAVDDAPDAHVVYGYAFCQLVHTHGAGALRDISTLYLDDLCVDEAARGRKVGRQLYEHVVAYARSCGCYNVTLNVWAKNPSAIAFYERLGLTVQKYHLEQIL